MAIVGGSRSWGRNKALRLAEESRVALCEVITISSIQALASVWQEHEQCNADTRRARLGVSVFTFWRHGASPHTIPLPRRTLLRPGIAPVPKAEINPTKAGRPRARRRGSSYIGWPSRSAGTRRRARGLAPASQATANVPGRLALRSHNGAAGSTRDGVTTTSQRQAGRVMECTASLHGSSYAVCNKPGWVRTAQSLILKRARQ
jgi:hypothetical protein